MAVDLTRQKELDADPKAIQVEFVGQLTKLDGDGNDTDAVMISLFLS